jgi:hypothetical protein
MNREQVEPEKLFLYECFVFSSDPRGEGCGQNKWVA